MQQSKDQIVLSVMAEDDKTLAQMEEVASIDGIGLVSRGSTDLSLALGATGPTDP